MTRDDTWSGLWERIKARLGQTAKRSIIVLVAAAIALIILSIVSRLH